MLNLLAGTQDPKKMMVSFECFFCLFFLRYVVYLCQYLMRWTNQDSWKAEIQTGLLPPVIFEVSNGLCGERKSICLDYRLWLIIYDYLLSEKQKFEFYSNEYKEGDWPKVI